MSPVQAGVRISELRGGRLRATSWAALHDVDWSSFALVLGAGGATGVAFEAGVLLALAYDHGVRLESAAAVIGTSAGALGAALIGAGCSASDLAAAVAEAEEHLSAIAVRLGVRPIRDLPQVPGVAAVLRWPDPRRVAQSIALIARRQFTGVLLQALRTGTHDFRPHVEFLRGLRWEQVSAAVRICATELRSGRRAVFDGADGTPFCDARRRVVRVARGDAAGRRARPQLRGWRPRLAHERRPRRRPTVPRARS